VAASILDLLYLAVRRERGRN